MSTVSQTMDKVRPAAASRLIARIRERQAALVAVGVPVKPFALALPDGGRETFGSGAPAFTLKALTEKGVAVLGSFDELSIAESVMNGELDVEGEVMQSIRYRAMLSDRRPLRYLMATYITPLFAGQVSSDKKWIASHYDIDPEFFLLWLDKKMRGYSHGFFENDGESLETGMERKFQWAMNACRIKPGGRVLDIGGGWGSFCEYAGKQGVHVTSLTISKESEKFLNGLIARHSLPCKAELKHFLEYRCEQPYDAIVNFGVTEHLPDYKSSVANYTRLLKPGGRIYLDFYSGERHGMPSFITKWVYEGNTSPCSFKHYMDALSRTPLEIVTLENDRHNYYLTCKKWAENLEEARDEVVARWGNHLYQRFRLYLWSAANSFDTGSLSAHHMVLEKSAE